MIDYFLKFSDEAEAQTVLYADGQPNYRNIDVIGVLMNNNDPENPAVIPGWHVNVRSDEVLPELEPFKVNPEPATPSRVWA